MGSVRGAAVLICPEERHIQAVTGIGEIVRVAAKGGDAVFRGEDQPDVGVLLVAVQVVFSARVEGHDFAASVRIGGAFLLDPGHIGPAGPSGLGGRSARGDTLLHFARNVLHGNENIRFQVRARFLLRLSGSVEAVLHVVVFAAAELLDALGRDVMVGEQQTSGRHEGARSHAHELHRPEPQLVEEAVRHLEPVLLLHSGLRKLVEKPDALVGHQRRRGQHGQHSRHRKA